MNKLHTNERGIRIMAGCCSCKFKTYNDCIRICTLDGEEHKSNDCCTRWECHPRLEKNAGNGEGHEVVDFDFESYYTKCAIRNKKYKNRK